MKKWERWLTFSHFLQTMLSGMTEYRERLVKRWMSKNVALPAAAAEAETLGSKPELAFGCCLSAMTDPLGRRMTLQRRR